MTFATYGRSPWPRALMLASAAVVTAAIGLSAAPAQGASGPAWRIASASLPTNLVPGSTGKFFLTLRNTSTAPSDGSTVAVVDRLPPGVSAVSAQGVGWTCAGVAVVTCTSSAVIAAESAQTLMVEVAVLPGAFGSPANVVTAAGGGAIGEARSSNPTTIGFSPAGFAFAGFEQLTPGPDGAQDTQAGSHPNSLTTSFTVNNVGSSFTVNKLGELIGLEAVMAGEPKELEINLPVGFVGNPDAAPRCPRALFDEGRKERQEPNCPADTRVGTVSLYIGMLSQVLEFPVYNLEPPPGMPAQFAFAFQYRVGFIDANVRTGEGYALKAVLHNIDQLGLVSASLTLWGVPAEHGSGTTPIAMFTNPTSCGVPLQNTTRMDSWEEPATFVTGTYPITDAVGNQLQMTGCAKLPFTPTVAVKPEASAASTPTGLEVDVKLPQNEEPESLAEANLKDAVVTLPAGVTVSPSGANGLAACTPTQIGLDNDDTPACPEASKIGAVEVTTPLLEQPLTGSVYVAQQDNNPFGSLLAIYLTAEADGVLVKLAGHVQTNPSNGQLTVTFDENPQLPFSDLKVTVFGGPGSPLMTPAACGSYTTNARLTGWNGAVATPPIAPFRVASGCEPPGFTPSFTAGMTSNAAGAFGTFSTTITRPDGDQPLGAISITPPPGLLGMLSQVPLCDEVQAAQGSCPAASRIGGVTAIAGPGALPVTVGGGRVFLTGPYKGAPFGLSIVVPAVAGPFNLGSVVVRAAIDVDPNTAQVTVVSDPLPTILQGIPLDIRAVNVSIDRPGFMFNPTSCEPLSSSAQIASSQGASVSLSSRFQAADCASLGFHPGFAVSTSAHTSKANGASLSVKVSSGPGQANIGKVDLQLPKQLPARLTTLQKACTEAQFNANPAGCPAASMIGDAKAITPILNVPLVGPAILVSHGGAAFPDVEFILQGQGVTIDLDGKTQIKKGVTYSRFETVPDAPITSFETVLPQGPHSVLAANLPVKARGSLCGSKLVLPTTLVGQNGAVISQSTKLGVSGCPRVKKDAKKKRGYAGASVSVVVARARVSRRSFEG